MIPGPYHDLIVDAIGYTFVFSMGGCFGFFLAALMNAAKQGDRHTERDEFLNEQPWD
jgi:hypothetical protein